MRAIIKNERPLFKKFKSYSAAEIIAAGGATEFGKLTKFDPKKLYHLGGEAITEEELQEALKSLAHK
jgi:hypothetical protein